MDKGDKLVQITVSLPKSHVNMLPELMKVVINARFSSYSWDSIKLNFCSEIACEKDSRIVLNLSKVVTDISEIVHGKFHKCEKQVCNHEFHYEGLVGDIKITSFLEKSIGDYIRKLSKYEEDGIKRTGWLGRKLSDEIFYPSLYNHSSYACSTPDKTRENCNSMQPTINFNNIGFHQFSEQDFELNYPLKRAVNDNEDVTHEPLRYVSEQLDTSIAESGGNCIVQSNTPEMNRKIRLLKERTETLSSRNTDDDDKNIEITTNFLHNRFNITNKTNLAYEDYLMYNFSHFASETSKEVSDESEGKYEFFENNNFKDHTKKDTTNERLDFTSITNRKEENTSVSKSSYTQDSKKEHNWMRKNHNEKDTLRSLSSSSNFSNTIKDKTNIRCYLKLPTKNSSIKKLECTNPFIHKSVAKKLSFNDKISEQTDSGDEPSSLYNVHDRKKTAYALRNSSQTSLSNQVVMYNKKVKRTKKKVKENVNYSWSDGEQTTDSIKCWKSKRSDVKYSDETMNNADMSKKHSKSKSKRKESKSKNKRQLVNDIFDQGTVNITREDFFIKRFNKKFLTDITISKEESEHRNKNKSVTTKSWKGLLSGKRSEGVSFSKDDKLQSLETLNKRPQQKINHGKKTPTFFEFIVAMTEDVKHLGRRKDNKKNKDSFID